MTNRRRFTVCVALTCWCVLGAAFAPLSSGAQSLDNWQHGFYSLACIDPNVVVPLRDAHFPPEGCTRLRGIPLQLETTDGSILQRCETDQNGWCSLSGEFNTLYVLRAVESGWPEGLAPRSSPTLYSRESAVGSGIVFVRTDKLQPAPGNASIELHARLCPEDYTGTQLFDDCHGNPPEQRLVVSLSGPVTRSIETGANGNGTVTNLPPGAWSLRYGLPSGVASISMICADAATPGVELAGIETNSFPPDRFAPRTHMTLSADEHLVCDLYLKPFSEANTYGTITFHLRFCDGILPPDQMYAACHDRGGAGPFLVKGYDPSTYTERGTLDADGNVTLRVPPGQYFITDGALTADYDSYVFCSLAGSDSAQVEYYPYVDPGEDWVCDVYLAPPMMVYG